MNDETDTRLPIPSVTRIDYAHPETCVSLAPSLGDAERIRALSAQIGGEGVGAIVAIAIWIDRRLTYDPTFGYAWRNCDTILDTMTYGSCADHAILFGALLRAMGIPTVWVKTMDEDWIREFRATGGCETWRGHVYLEVFVNKRWRLLDAQRMTLWEDYTPDIRSLPDCRYVYDKGDDPFEMVLSLDWDRWKRQTATYFGDFDMGQLETGRYECHRPGSCRHLLDVYVAADSPVYTWISEQCAEIGYRVQIAFNTDFAEVLAKACGSCLIITCVGDRLILPEAYREEYLPLPFADIQTRLAAIPSGRARHSLADGTDVIVIYSQDLAAMRDEILHLAL